MYPTDNLPRPLSHGEFYTLLSLVHGPLHAYGIVAEGLKRSYWSVDLGGGKVYPLLTRMAEEGLVEVAPSQPAGSSGKVRIHYKLSEYGQIRLQEEGKRLKHAVAILERAGIIKDQ